MVFLGYATLFLIVAAPSARADAWGTNIGASILKEVMEQIREKINGVLLSVTKTAATATLSAQVESLIGGSNVGNSRIVTDWEVYLYQDPLEETGVYMDSYLTAMTSGRSASNYSTGASGGSYSSYIRQYTEGNLVSMSSSHSVPTTNAEEQIGDFQNEIGKGNIGAINVYFQGVNNPFAATLAARAQEQATYESLQKIQESKAIAYGGYTGTETEDGKIVTPGSTVRDVVADVYGIGPNIIASSNNPEELIDGVVLAAVNKTVTGLFQRGLGAVRSNIQREISSVSAQLNSQVDRLTSTSGTLQQYTTGVLQQTGASSASSADPSRAVPISI